MASYIQFFYVKKLVLFEYLISIFFLPNLCYSISYLQNGVEFLIPGHFLFWLVFTIHCKEMGMFKDGTHPIVTAMLLHLSSVMHLFFIYLPLLFYITTY